MVPLASSPSIQETNAAIIAQYKASQAAAANANKAPATGGSGFAGELQAIEKQELPPPTKLSPSKTTNINNAQAASSEEGGEQEGQQPKISRSARMESAEKTTEVAYSDDDFGFDDFVDFINPLHHIPIIGSLYRELTGDTIKPEVQVAGSMAFGLATGSVVVSTISGIVSAAVEQSTGKEPVIMVADALFGDKIETPDPVTEPKIGLADNSFVQDLYQSLPDMPAQNAPAKVADAGEAAVQQPTDNKQNAAQQSVQKVAQAVQHNPERDHTAAALANSGGVRMGNVVYTSPLMRSAAKVAPAGKGVVAGEGAANSAARKVVSRTETASNLAEMMQTQAKTRESGQNLPPELIQDMMLKAMDKYQAAHALGTPIGQEIYVD